MTFSFNWHGPATDYPPDSVQHSGAGRDELMDRIATAMKHAAHHVLQELGSQHVTVSGYGSIASDTDQDSVVSLHVSVPQPAPAASPPSPAASVPDGSPPATAPGTEAGGGAGESIPGSPGSGGPDLAQPADEKGSPDPDAAASTGESS